MVEQSFYAESKGGAYISVWIFGYSTYIACVPFKSNPQKSSKDNSPFVSFGLHLRFLMLIERLQPFDFSKTLLMNKVIEDGLHLKVRRVRQ
ncbi:hypothetical protein CDZ95_25320 [Mameliella alba]|nr:hypothetical protein CDZ95_25320 [Mameliella alba]